jgi:hypothetical protein
MVVIMFVTKATQTLDLHKIETLHAWAADLFCYSQFLKTPISSISDSTINIATIYICSN